MTTLRYALLGLLLLYGADPAWTKAAASAKGGPAHSRKGAQPKKFKRTPFPLRTSTLIKSQPVQAAVAIATVAPAAVSVASSAAEAPAVPKAAEPQAAAGPPLPDPLPCLAALGLALREGDDSAPVIEVLPGSQAQALGVCPQDRLAFLNGSAVRSRAEAAQAWRGWSPGMRLWAVALRGLRTAAMQSRHPEEETAFKRGPKDLSAREARFLAERLEDSAQAAKAALADAPPLAIDIPARQVFWIRFPAGIKDSAATSDVVTGEVTMAVASSADLDFLCLPPRSLVWGKIIKAAAVQGTRTLRIHFFKARLAGGHVIPISARITDAAGEQPLVKVSPDGTLVVGEPLAQKRKRGGLLLEPEVRLRLEFDEPAAVVEPPQFYLAGPGLWIRTKDTEAGRQFEVTHIIPNRSAEKEGLRVGDLLTAIAGRSSARLEFEDALASLYGAPGSRVKVAARKPDEDKPQSFELKRGVFYKDGVETALPLPFEKTDNDRAKPKP